jgi:RHS repeat-associated protein
MRTILAFLATCTAAVAQTLPPPPVSPTPVTRYEYDAQGNLTRTIQAPGVLDITTSHSYDRLERRTATTDARAGVTAIGYDGQDRVTRVTDPRSLVTQYPRNGLGDVNQVISPDTGTANQTFDVMGNLRTRTDSRGVLATYSYDPVYRLTGIAYTQGANSLTRTWTYDQTGTGFSYGIGRLTSTAFPGGSTRYMHSPLGDVVQATQTTGSVTLTTGYAWWPAGKLTRITYPSGRVLTLTYAHGLPVAMSLAADANATPQPLLSQIQYQPFGPVKSWNWQMATGAQPHQRVYDLNGRIVRHTLGTMVRDITYDAADRITSYTHLNADGTSVPALNQSFGYDQLGRLTQVLTANAVWTIPYDANGNRRAITVNGNPSNSTISPTSNRITQISNPARSFTFDAAGNTTADTAPSAPYNASYGLDNRLDTLTRGTTTASYLYDNAGQRVRKTVNGTSTHFVYDTQGHLLGEYGQTGQVIREYVWLGDVPVAVFMPDPANPSGAPQVFYVHTDHIDTPRMVLDRNGNVRWRWLAEPFGAMPAEDNPAGLGAFVMPLRFPGQYFDQESGLHYNWWRYYDSTGGRYQQSDPIGLHGGINTYAYVGGDPLSHMDPEGLRRTQNGHYTPYRPRPRFPNPGMPRPVWDQGNPWMDAAGYFNDEGEFVCLRWKCGGSDMCFSDPYDQRGRFRRSTDFLPAQTDPTNSPEGCVCDAPRFMPKGAPSLWDEKDWADLYGRWRNRPPR